MKRVLFYGSLESYEYDKAKRFLERFIPKLLERGFQIITREGNVPKENEHGWMDNLVLDIACDYRDKHKLAYNSVISFRLDSQASASMHDREIITLQSADRFAGYHEMLSKCDVAIAIGGRDGVYRFGLVAAATGHFYLPLSVVDGVAAQKMSRELRDYIASNYSKNLVEYMFKNHFEEAEIETLITEISTCLNNPRSNACNEITEAQFLEYLENNPDTLTNLDFKHVWRLLKKLPIKTFIPLFTLLLTFLVLFIVNIVLG